jgi:hypothetical protein
VSLPPHAADHAAAFPSSPTPPSPLSSSLRPPPPLRSASPPARSTSASSALGKIQLKDDEGAEVDLKEALKNVPGDAGITRALKEVEVKRKERKDKERKAYAKMFA